MHARALKPFSASTGVRFRSNPQLGQTPLTRQVVPAPCRRRRRWRVCDAVPEDDKLPDWPAMPRLPPRPKPDAGGSGAPRSRRTAPKPPAAPGEQEPWGAPKRPPGGRTFLAMLTFAGLTGTVATLMSRAYGMDLFGGWAWDAADVRTALALMLPVAALNVLIMAPEWNSWQLPTEAMLERERAALAALSGGDSSGEGASPGAPAGSGSEASSSGSGGDASSSSAAAGGEAAHLPAQVPAGSWGRGRGGAEDAAAALAALPWPRALKDALHLAQGHYVSVSPGSALPAPVEAVAVVADSLATEMLYRAAALTLVGGWIADRMHEGGASELIDAGLLGVYTTSGLSRGAAVSVLAAFSLLLYLRRAAQVMRPRVARELAQDEGRARQLERDMRKAAAARLDGSKPTGGAAPQQQPAQQPNQQQQPSRQQAAPPPPGVYDVLVLSQLVQGFRNLSESSLLGLAYVATGNLAAVWVAASFNNLLMSYLQRAALERTKQRSAALQEELQALNAKLLDLAIRQASAKKLAAAEERRRETEAESARQAQAATAAAARGDGKLAQTLNALDALLGEQPQ